jgi:hypothetical protein
MLMGMRMRKEVPINFTRPEPWFQFQVAPVAPYSVKSANNSPGRFTLLLLLLRGVPQPLHMKYNHTIIIIIIIISIPPTARVLWSFHS